MEDLGQQQLLERPKPRSLIVPRGADCWWGVDASSRAVAIGVANTDGILVGVETFPVVAGLARLSVIYEGTRTLVQRILEVGGTAPGIIGVEQPSGSAQHVNHELEFAVGVTIAGVYDGVRAVAAPARMELVVSSWWKLRSCGNGAARKTRKVPGRKRPVALPLEEYEVMRWARLNGYTGESWDAADAMGIAAAMRSEWDLVPR